MAATVCGEPGCPNLVPCLRHPPKDRRSPSSRITGTHRWRMLKAKILRRDHYRCQLRLSCCIGRATTADHKIPVAVRLDLAWDESNLAASCIPCNARKNARPA